jgi:LysM repeat protein
MVRFARALALLVCCAPGALLAQDTPGSNAPAGDELKVLRQMLEQQSKQIDVLAQEIARLNLLLEAKTPTADNLGPSPGAVAAARAEASAAAPAEPSIPTALPADATETPKAVPAGPVHIIAKGETLTAIAKRYKVTVPDLLKVNKIADVRKLQIGQTLALPPGAKVPESPTPSPQP